MGLPSDTVAVDLTIKHLGEAPAEQEAGLPKFGENVEEAHRAAEEEVDRNAKRAARKKLTSKEKMAKAQMLRDKDCTLALQCGSPF